MNTQTHMSKFQKSEHNNVRLNEKSDRPICIMYIRGTTLRQMTMHRVQNPIG